MRRIIAVIVLAAALSLAACGGNKTEAKNEYFTDEFFDDVVQIKLWASVYGDEEMKIIENAMKDLVFEEETVSWPWPGEEVEGSLDFYILKENGDIYEFTLIRNKVSCSIRPNGSETPKARYFGNYFLESDSFNTFTDIVGSTPTGSNGK